MRLNNPASALTEPSFLHTYRQPDRQADGRIEKLISIYPVKHSVCRDTIHKQNHRVQSEFKRVDFFLWINNYEWPAWFQAARGSSRPSFTEVLPEIHTT